MNASIVFLKIGAHWQLAWQDAVRKLRSCVFFRKINSSCRLHHQLPPPLHSKCSLEGREGQTLVCDDFHGTLLATHSLFPYFMLMAFEGGGLLRALLLLLLSPWLWLLGERMELALRIMVFVTFCGLQTRDVDLVSRAVLPKFYLENLHPRAYEMLMAFTGKRVVVTSLPRLMVEGFLREYLAVNEVVGAELHVVGGCYFTGLIVSASTVSVKQRAFKELFGDAMADVALLSSSSLHVHDHLFISCSKEIYVVNREECFEHLPRNKYPKPLIFHDGRLAFLPTPAATLALFLWLPLAIPLSVFRIGMGVVFPYKLVLLIAALTGLRLRIGGHERTHRRKGALYVCTHRTLLDPVMLCTGLQRPVPAVTYGLSRLSEFLAPMKTVRLTRDRDRDAATMRRLLADCELAVCPEGTTCREPYLLRFSPLFAELAEDIVPVALDAEVGMLYGTTASGRKWLDSVVFMMNPAPGYKVDILEPVPREMTRAGGLGAADVANRIQVRLAEALGFECTSLTRRDKYRMLAGNEGVVSLREGKKRCM
ncbi:hypothetical protein Cni_G07971 [Canna indica]|uniref:Phospholipid/glycerol acyltransferase domain-containing protein n=1 Tax=Canna indica TaxID=4628 RepID=A0AAQ3JZG7_9LILI|nr:hypothetical protein Cni_G07971 [Canna indica]